jgi:NTP pyrophosphatase (non-canonical NTP hydrolase)
MAGEQGEACNLAKKIDRILDDTRGNPEGMTLTSLEADLKDEIADVVIYADLLAQALGTSLELIVRRKWNKSSEKIGYPERL